MYVTDSALDGEEEEEEATSSDDDARSTATSTTTAAGGRAVVRVRGREVELHSVDVRGADFLALPADVRHEILTELKETRKQSSWGRLHEMPRMKRLLQRRSVQQSLEAAEREMGGRSMSLAELEALMAETGVLAAAAALPGQRIAADARARFVLLTGQPAGKANITSSKIEENASETKFSDSVEEDTSVVDEATVPKAENIAEGFFEEYYSDEEIPELLPEFDYTKMSKIDSDDIVTKQLKAAHNFIFENSGLTQEEIFTVIKDHSSANKSTSLDEPSTSKVCFSNIVELSNSKGKSDLSLDSQSVTPSTSSCSELNVPVTSADVVSDYSAKKSDQTNNQNENILSSNYSSRNVSKCQKLNCDVKENVMEVDIKQRDYNDDEKEAKGSRIEEDKKVHQHSPDSSVEYLDKLSNEKGISDQGDVTSVSDSDLIISPKVYLEEKCKEMKKVSSDQISQVTCNSFINISLQSSENYKNGKYTEEKHSCSSDEDFIEVKELDQSAAKFKESQKTQPKVAPLEVVIKASMKDIEEDIFADVFEECSKPLANIQPNITKTVMTADNVLTNEINSSLLSKTPSIKTPQNSVQQNEHFKNILKNADVEETAVPHSPTSDSENVMVMTDSGSEIAEEISESLEVSEESNYNTSKREPVKLSTEQLEELQDSLQQEGNRLRREQAREERLAASITEQMTQEAQELLQLFGVPYVLAPMEAEAQCAFLDRLSLTDGTITDDSDIWLFGGQKVYKNFFDQKKHVLQFRDIDILQSFKLTRSQLVLLALLVGSDYTTGVPGVGPVTALEILAAFPARSKQGPPDELVEGLRRFREWYTSGTMGRRDKAKLRNKLKDLELTTEFPSVTVVEAYLSPKVDESLEKFSWGTPDVESIKEFARVKFGWPTSKTHEILQPIMKKMNIKISQLTIENYFQPKPSLPPGGGNLSKRVQEAIEKMDASGGSDSEDESSPMKKIKIASGPKLRGKSETMRKIHATLKKVQGPASSFRANRGRGRSIKQKNNMSVVGEDIQTEGRPGTSVPIPGPSGCTSNATTITNPGNRCSKKPMSGPFATHVEKEFILQKEKDKLNLLKNKMKAIEVFRKSARGLDKTQRDRKKKRTVLKEAHLSESSESD
ncbi:Flap endonuclease 1 [Gryllus bimaculatus]|nr:Flap endonuclease 1 [Gryllus bimaculatus]